MSGGTAEIVAVPGYNRPMGVLTDVRVAFRGLSRAPGVAVAAILTLSLGIAAVTTSVAALEAVVWRPIVPEPHRVVHVQGREAQQDRLPVPLSLPEIEDLARHSRSFDVVAAVDHAATGPTAVVVGGQPTPIRLAPVTAGLFGLAVHGGPLLGRWLDEQDAAAAGEVAAVISERLWRRLGGTADVVGTRLTWAGTRSLRVVGVAPAALDYPLGTDIWAPAARVFDGQAGRFDARQRSFPQFEMLGRLRPDVTLAAVAGELAAVHDGLDRAYPRARGPLRLEVVPLADVVLGDSRRWLQAIAAGAALVFLIAGVNVAALLLMRASARGGEMAIRVALGAGPARLARQTVVEAAVIAVPSVAAGLVASRLLLAVLPALAPGDIPRLDTASHGGMTFAVAAGVAVAWVLLLGSAPAWFNARRPARIDRGFARAPRSRALVALTTAEVAAAVVVAVGAGLLARSVAQLQAVDLGFRPAQVHLVSLLLPDARQKDPRALLRLYGRLLPELEAHPDVVSAAPIHLEPGTGTIGLSAPMRFEGQSPTEAAANTWATWEPVMPGYFGTLGMPIVRGRAIDDRDRQGGAPVAVITESVARRYWPGVDPLGRQLKFVDRDDWPWVTVVGVAGDTRYRELRRPWMTVYFPADQFFYFQADSLVVRTTAAPGLVRTLVSERLAALEPAAAVDTVSPLPDLLARETARPRAALAVAGAFALLSVLLAAVGVYGVLSYDVRQRRHELAVRAAVGASPGALLRAVLTRGAAIAAVGSTVGLATGLFATRALQSLLFEVQPADPAVLATAVVGLAGVVLAATLLPARRAATADPVTALRSE